MTWLFDYAWLGFAIAYVALAAYVVYQDFWYWRIPNRAVFGLSALWVAQSWLLGNVNWPMDLIAAGLLFVMGVVYWRLRLMGAGDAKLMLPLGLMIGWQGLMAFAIWLLVFTLLTYLLLKATPRWITHHHRVWRRLRIIAAKGRVPFGIPLVAATLAAMASNSLIGN